MQISERFRRSIVVPRDLAAQEDLDCEDVDYRTQVDVLWLDDDNLFNQAWDEGVFERINDAANALIGDYETEKLMPQQIEMAMQALRGANTNFPAVRAFIDDLCALCELAIERKVPMYFVL
jgi:hypothetical protein